MRQIYCQFDKIYCQFDKMPKQQQNCHFANKFYVSATNFEISLIFLENTELSLQSKKYAQNKNENRK